jgi:hypothetical protein
VAAAVAVVAVAVKPRHCTSGIILFMPLRGAASPGCPSCRLAAGFWRSGAIG